VEKAVDTALHDVCDMLECFFPFPAGQGHCIDLALGVRVYNANDKLIETIVNSPNMLDLPIGYWTWVEKRRFRSLR
jgi:hypothetical protein